MVPYFSFLLQALTIQLDEAFLVRLIGMITSIIAKNGPDNGNSTLQLVEDDTLLIANNALALPKFDQSSHLATQQIYFELFQIQPIRLNLSFIRSKTARQDIDENSPETGRNQVAVNLLVVVDILSMALGNIQGTPISFNALELVHCNLSENNALSLVVTNLPFSFSKIEKKSIFFFFFFLLRQGKHYEQQGITQIYKVIGSFDILGNPVSYISGISSGVEDFFYEPYRGIVRSPKDFAVGVGKGMKMSCCILCTFLKGFLFSLPAGTASLLKNTVGGLFTGVSKITGSVGKGLAEATLDDEFQEKRQEDRMNQPKNVVSGVAAGAVTFAKGVGSGLIGIVSKPVEGAKQDGAKGFFKGLGKGAVGVVTKPVVGLFDGASKGNWFFFFSFLFLFSFSWKLK